MCIVMAASPKPATHSLRPSLVIAEALVDRQDPGQIVDRARKLGLSPVLTNTVVSVCCGQRHCAPPHAQASATLTDAPQP